MSGDRIGAMTPTQEQKCAHFKDAIDSELYAILDRCRHECENGCHTVDDDTAWDECADHKYLTEQIDRLRKKKWPELLKVKERPILFSGPMVRAILEGRKTQTRRIIKKIPELPRAIYGTRLADTKMTAFTMLHSEGLAVKFNWEMTKVGDSPAKFSDTEWGPNCPYGQPGDRLWVRETFFNNTVDKKDHENVVYRADGEAHEQFPEDYLDWAWSPSIHMPRWASRINLEVVNVRAERLWDITEEDAKAEGVEMVGKRFKGLMKVHGEDYNPALAKTAYSQLWTVINGKGSWEANPWVWVVEFRHIK
jgi:hypothetical protein